MNKILKSLSVIAFVAAIAVGATSAYFSDEEKAAATFTAGTIDIQLNGGETQTTPYAIADVKPDETGYINFNITNVGTNPVNVSKNLSDFVGTTGSVAVPCANTDGVSSEPECEAVHANGDVDLNDLQNQIIYDLSVEVYNGAGEKTWWQTIYTDAEGRSLLSVYPDATTYVALGMIPVGGHMKVTQSYKFDYRAGNIYQGDQLAFNINIKGEQLTGADGMASVVLENKTFNAGQWDIIQNDGISGTLKYKTQGPLFVYTFTGVAPLKGHNYVLAVGNNVSTDVDTQIGTGISDVTTGSISISGSVATAGSLPNAKAWLIPPENWSGTAMIWTGFPAMVPNFLWETGLINYTKN